MRKFNSLILVLVLIAAFSLAACNEESSETGQDVQLASFASVQCDEGICLDPNFADLYWQQFSPTGTYAYDDAIAYCEDLEIDGYDDWRMPDITELRSLIRNCDGTEIDGACMVSHDYCYFNNHSCMTPACDGCAAGAAYWDPAFKGSATHNYWSYTLDDSGQYQGAWVINFGAAALNTDPLGESNMVRCVRGGDFEPYCPPGVCGPEEPERILECETYSGDNYCTDYDFAIAWQNQINDLMTWWEAKQFCEDLTYVTATEWRLPTISELRTLIQSNPSTMPGGECVVEEDVCDVNNCIEVGGDDSCTGLDGGYCHWDPQLMASCNGKGFWSSTTVRDLPATAWFVGFYDGGISTKIKNEKINVMCVHDCPDCD